VHKGDFKEDKEFLQRLYRSFGTLIKHGISQEWQVRLNWMADFQA